jgi:hypothetical protein
VPHLAFYASVDDVAPIMDFVLAECVAYESHSIPDQRLRTFSETAGVLAALGDRSNGMRLMLHAATMKGSPMVERFELKPGAGPSLGAHVPRARPCGRLGLQGGHAYLAPDQSLHRE